MKNPRAVFSGMLVSLLMIALSVVAGTQGITQASASERGTIIVKVKETKNKGLTVIVEGKVRKIDIQGTYETTVSFHTPDETIQKNCTVSPTAPQFKETISDVESLVCHLDMQKTLVAVTYKRFGQMANIRYEGNVEIKRQGQVVMNGTGEGILVGLEDPPPEPAVVKLLVAGETGEGNVEQVQVAQAMSQKCQDEGGCTAVLMTGNQFFDSGVSSVDDPQWIDKFESPYDQPGLNGLKFYPVLGIHDYCLVNPICDTIGSPSSAESYIQYSLLPVGAGPGTRRSGKWTMPARFYDVAIEDGDLVHIFGIDTQDTAGGTPNDQPEIIQQKIANSSSTWKIVFGSFPRFTSGSSNEPISGVGSPLDLLDQSTGIIGPPGLFSLLETVYCESDLYIAGHDNIREFINKGRDPNCPNTFFAISAAGAKTTNSTAPLDQSSLFLDDTTVGFAYLELTETSLLFEFYDKDGNLSFSKILQK